MKSLLAISIAFALMLMPFGLYAQSEQRPTNAPPVSQQLVPEGDFALELVPALHLGSATTEAQAEDMLTSVGIAPKNGWIADYPMTPIIIGEVQSAVVTASDTQKLPMGKDEALKAFQGLTTEFGLSVVPGSSESAESQPPTSNEYVQPSVVNNYYYEEGPPVVTYYPPPWDYYYLYAWVPYPFWCSGFFFPGFFVLSDFNVIVAGNFHGHHHHHHVITNHFVDPKTHAVIRVDPTTRTIGRTVNVSYSRFRGFNSNEARKGATSIFERSRTRQMTTMNPTLRGPSRGEVPKNREQTRPSTIERGMIPNRGSRSLSTPNNIQRPSENSSRSFGTPSRSFTVPRSSIAPSFEGRGSSSGFHGGGGFSGSFHGGGFGHGGGRGRG
jgi:uncharacterized membrane protein YgcG